MLKYSVELSLLSVTPQGSRGGGGGGVRHKNITCYIRPQTLVKHYKYS